VSLSHISRLLVPVLGLLSTASSGHAPPFGPGEQLVFRTSFLGIPAGTVQVTVGAEFPDRPGVWPIVAFGRTDPGMFFFPVRDKVVIHWDVGGERTLGMEMWADENHKRQRLRIVFDRAGGTARVLRQWEGQEPAETEVAVEPGSTDVASAIYLLRTRELEPGHELSIPILTPSKQFALRAVVERREQLHTPLGERTTVRVRLTTDFSGKLKAKRDLIIHFTDDEAHVPVRFESDFAWGTVVAELSDFHPGRVPAPPPAATIRPEVR